MFSQNLLCIGDVSALMTLGAFYNRGTGVEKSYEKSFQCYKAAADQGIQFFCESIKLISMFYQSIVKMIM